MNDSKPPPDIPDDLPEAVGEPRRRHTVQLVWIIPIIAALIAGTLAVRALIERGRTITITFKTGEGLEAGTTRIKYREVDVGVVERIAIAKDSSHVVVTAKMEAGTKELLVKDTRFWVVRPRIHGGYVSGLGTLVEGAYIGADVGKSKTHTRTFRGLEAPPVITSDLKGSTFVLRGSDLGSLNISSPIFFRRLQVGQVSAFNLDRDGRAVTFTIFINAPYDRYVRKSTLFWHSSGIDITLNPSGLKVNSESLVSVLVGGVAFESPEDERKAPMAPPGASFTLFRDRETAEKNAKTPLAFRLEFRESVRGLLVNAPVEFRGVNLGEVSGIGLEYDRRKREYLIVTEVRLYPDRLMEPRNGEIAAEEKRAFISRLVDRGLRAQLGSRNLLTGQRYVALEFFPGERKSRIDWNRQPPLFPTSGRGEAELQATLARIASKFEEMPLREISEEVRRSAESLNRSLRSTETILRKTDAELLPEAQSLMRQARETLHQADGLLASDSPMQHDLREMVRELSRTLRSVRALTEYLERHPEALIRGKKQE